MIRNRDELLGAGGDARRVLALEALEAAVGAVEPRGATRAIVRRLREDGEVLDGCVVLAFGKAARAMAEGALEECAPRGGLVVGFEEGPLGPLRSVAASHPVPGERSVAAGREMLDLARSLGPADVALCLVSGGGSAMLEVPADGVTLEELRAETDRLMRAGADIAELNARRCELSRIKGGRLAEAIHPARVINVILSDVPGHGPEVVASGPTLPSQGSQVRVRTEIAGDNLTAREAMVACLASHGLRVLHRDGFAAGEARRVGAAFYRDARASGADAVVWGGETTVDVRGDGIGGRNEELVLGALEVWRGGLLASIGTDGVDGASEAAGALLDGDAVSAARAQSLDGADHLARNDADRFFARVGGRIVTGRTGTNVADVCLYLT